MSPFVRATSFKLLTDCLSSLSAMNAPAKRAIDQYSENEWKRVLEGRDRKKSSTDNERESGGGERAEEPWVASEEKNELCEESKMLVTMGAPGYCPGFLLVSSLPPSLYNPPFYCLLCFRLLSSKSTRKEDGERRNARESACDV